MRMSMHAGAISRGVSSLYTAVASCVINSHRPIPEVKCQSYNSDRMNLIPGSVLVITWPVKCLLMMRRKCAHVARNDLTEHALLSLYVPP